MKLLLRLMFLSLTLSGCGSQTTTNPSATLRETGRPSSVHINAMNTLDEQVGIQNEDYQKLLQRLLWAPGYTNEARLEAVYRLWAQDPEGTIRVIRQQLPRLNNWSWLTELCQWIAEEEVLELNEALISSWASPSPIVVSEDERPEYIALVAMNGEDAVIDVVFEK